MTTPANERHDGIERSPVAEPRLVTMCGRRIEVRRLRLGRADRPVSRIALDVGEDRGGVPGAWASLTPEEARGLARLLLRQAGATEHPADDPFSH